MVKMRKTSNMIQGLRELSREIKNRAGYMPEVVEIGAFAGEGTGIIIQYASKVWAVDPWAYGYDHRDPASNKKNIENAEVAFDNAHANNDKIVKLKMTSVEAVNQFSEIDWVYIDGNHKYENVLLDIKAWSPICKIAIAGHDYVASGNNAGVKKAVDKILGKPDRVFQDTSWVKFL